LYRLTAALPFTETGRKKYEANQAFKAKGDYESYDMTMARCSSPGAPRLMLTPDRFRLFVRPAAVYMMFEWNRVLRLLDMNPNKKLEMPDWGTVTGQNRGNWDGDVLVVESLGFNRKRLLDNLIPNSEDLKLVERRLKDRTLENRIYYRSGISPPWETVLHKREPSTVIFREDVHLDRIAAGQPRCPVTSAKTGPGSNADMTA
jgi:hypothetical protein